MKIDKYIKELRETLEKRSVEELEKFMKKWVNKGIVDASVYKNFVLSSPETKLGTLCKMICNNFLDIKEDTKEWARAKLKEIGMTEETY